MSAADVRRGEHVISAIGAFDWDVPREKPTPKLLQVDPLDAAILKFLAGTTFRDTETSIIKRALRREMAAMLRSRGYSVVETDAQTGGFEVRAPTSEDR
ncbi:hypothetical protein [Aromatoleum evansii]|uniref:hypothetical protein n=1 Tax=Aromatoleum evansii TaxID=59406 RepID=UPI00145D182E|nr:hypothetical protein [Aromatoleum evansii]NMG30615.1 hypothetical protein [Aromatoleum evansii]